MLLPITANSHVLQPEKIHQHASVDFWVDTLDWYSIYWIDLDEGSRIYVNVDVTSGNDIDFFIADGENYDLWADGQSSSAYHIMSNVGSVSVSFSVPSSGEWRVVFKNDNWLYRKHIEGTITVYVPTTTSSPSSSLSNIGSLIIALVVVFLIVMMIACCKKLEDSKDPPQIIYSPNEKQHGPPLSPLNQHFPPRQDPVIMFCPYCGTQRQNYDAIFCSRCGKAFVDKR
jgi:hypothetical protein